MDSDEFFLTYPRLDAASAVLLANRSALRLLPGLRREDFDTSSAAILLLFRSLITTAYAAEAPDQGSELLQPATTIKRELEESQGAGNFHESMSANAEYCALAATNAFIFGETRNAFAAYDALFHVSSREFVDQVTRIDAKTLEMGKVRSLWEAGLWNGIEPPQTLSADTSAFLSALSKDEAWSFWHRWYQGILAGEPLDPKIRRAVALIKDDVWARGPESVAVQIREIEAEYVERRLPLAERIEFLTEVAKFRVVPTPIANPVLLAATLSQIDDALEDALANPSNGLTASSREARVLRRMFAKYADDPQRIEMDLVSVSGTITRQLVADELPATEEILALQEACEQGARALRATHPNIAENRRLMSNQAWRELPSSARDQLAEAAPVLLAISRGGACRRLASRHPPVDQRCY